MFTPKYKRMCERAKEIQEEFQKEIQNKLKIDEKIYVFHPEKEKREAGRLLRYNEKFVTTDKRSYENPLSKMIWVPTEEQIKEKAKQYEDQYDDFFNDDKAKRGHPARRFTQSEEKWLALYMDKKYRKEWSGRGWVEFEKILTN